MNSSETVDQSGAPDRSIYTRKVPGISNGELVGALYNDQKRTQGQPTLNDAFSRTSPALYQHLHNAQQAPMPRGVAFSALNASGSLLQPEFAPMSTSASLDQGTPISVVDASSEAIDPLDELRSVRRRIGSLDASVREYHAKEIARHGQVLESLESLQSALNVRTWILVAVGAVLLALIILLLCMLSKHIASTQRGKETNSAETAIDEADRANFLSGKNTSTSSA